MRVGEGSQGWLTGLRRFRARVGWALLGLSGISLAVVVFASSSQRVLMLEMDRVPPGALDLWRSGDATGKPVGRAFPGCRWGLPPGYSETAGSVTDRDHGRIGVDVFPVYCLEREAGRARTGGAHPFYYLRREFAASPHWHVAGSSRLMVEGMPLSRVEAWMVRAARPGWHGPGFEATVP